MHAKTQFVWAHPSEANPLPTLEITHRSALITSHFRASGLAQVLAPEMGMKARNSKSELEIGEGLPCGFPTQSRWPLKLQNALKFEVFNQINLRPLDTRLSTGPRGKIAGKGTGHQLKTQKSRQSSLIAITLWLENRFRVGLDVAHWSVGIHRTGP